MCVRVTTNPRLCTECGNGALDPAEECDATDPSDPHAGACNTNCQMNYCGDAEVMTSTYTQQIVRTRNSAGVGTTRPVVSASTILAQGDPGFSEHLDAGQTNGSQFGKAMSLLHDIDGDGFRELAVSAP